MAQSVEIQYADPFDYVPPIRKLFSQIYPLKFLTQVENSDLKQIKTHEDKSKSSTFQNLSLESFEKTFSKNPPYYDITEINFQNFALMAIKNENFIGLGQLSHSSNAAHRRLLRAVIYAICSREDVAWDGTLIDSSDTSLKQQKKQQLEDIHTSLKLYDWTLASSEDKSGLLLQRFDQACQFNIWKMDTQSAVEKLHEQYPEAKICWLSMTNAHEALGTFHANYGGSQEEDMANNSSIAVSLGIRAEFVSTGFSGYFTGESIQAVYKDGFHIPPGGNFFSSCKIVTSTPQIDCYVISAAFADFRPYWPLFVPWSERSEYYFAWGHVKNQERLERRLVLDIEAVCKTAIREGMDILVLGASGCGGFRHNAWMEARMWNEVLMKYEKCFKKIVFAVPADSKSPQNVAAFSYYFRNRETQNTLQKLVDSAIVLK